MFSLKSQQITKLRFTYLLRVNPEFFLFSPTKLMNKSLPDIPTFDGLYKLSSWNIWTADLRKWFLVNLKPTCCERTILWWSCFPIGTCKTAFRPGFLTGDFSRLTQTCSVLRCILCILDEAAWGGPDFTAGMASYGDSVDSCALTSLRVFSGIWKDYIETEILNEGISKKTDE
jgi:hypothetical protein